MKKQVLEKIECPYTMQDVFSYARQNENSILQGKWLASAWISFVDGKKVLVVDTYYGIHVLNIQKNPYVRVFLWDNGYTTRAYSLDYKSKWISGSLSYIMQPAWWSDKPFIGFINIQSCNAACDFFSVSENPMRALHDFQKAFIKKRLDKKHSKEKAEIDAVMDTVPGLPCDFKKWADDIALFSSRYFFYRYKKGKKLMDGVCSKCRELVKVEAPRHNAKGICPECASPITYKAMGKAGRIYDHVQAALLQRTTDGMIVLRIFNVRKWYPDTKDERWSLKKADRSCTEVCRGIYFSQDLAPISQKKAWYEWADFCQTGQTRWCNDTNKINIYDCALYDANLESVLKGTPWQFSRLRELATCSPGYAFNVYGFIEKFKLYPIIEYFIIGGFYRLASEMLNPWMESNVTQSATKLHDALRIKKESLSLLREVNPSFYQISVMRELDANNIRITKEQFEYLSVGNARGEFYQLLSRTSVAKFIRYAQKYANAAKKLSDFMNDWCDYVEACVQLKMQLTDFVLYPKHFQDAHDTRIAEAKEACNVEIDKNASEMLRQFSDEITILLKKTPSRFSQYIIVVPKSAQEIREEGTALHHCVGSYVNRVAQGETIIFFIRATAEPAAPLFTVEFRDGKIAQCRGFGNSVSAPVPKLVSDLVKWFEKEHSKIVQKEERTCA